MLSPEQRVIKSKAYLEVTSHGKKNTIDSNEVAARICCPYVTNQSSLLVRAGDGIYTLKSNAVKVLIRQNKPCCCKCCCRWRCKECGCFCCWLLG